MYRMAYLYSLDAKYVRALNIPVGQRTVNSPRRNSNVPQGRQAGKTADMYPL